MCPFAAPCKSVTHPQLWVLWSLKHGTANGFKLDPSFLSTLRKFYIHFIARLRWWRSANGTQPHFVKWWTVNHTNNVPWKSWGRPYRKRLGPKHVYICSVFLRLRDLMANICWMKHDIDNWARALQSTKGLLCCLKISWTLVYKQLKTGLEFLPILTILFCSSPSHTL